MKNFLFTITIIVIANTLLLSQSQYRFHINNINMPMDNKGVLADVYQIPGGQGGFYKDVQFLFSGGFMLSGYNGDSLWANAQATASLLSNYIPGKVGEDQFDPRNKIYVINKNDPDFGPTWQEWVYAVELGAGYYDGNQNSIYDPIDLNGNNYWDPSEDRPDLIGDQTAWCVFNDGDTTMFFNPKPYGKSIQGIEIRQTLFGYFTSASTSFSNMIFIRYELINSGLKNTILDSVYFSAWTDSDLGSSYNDDIGGADTLNFSGFIYNSQPDTGLMSVVPAFFINMLQGAPSYIPGVTFIDNNSNGYFDQGIDTPLDTAYNHLGPLRGVEEYEGARNSGMTSNIIGTRHGFLSGSPDSIHHIRNYQLGLDRYGELFDPCIYQAGIVLGGINCNEINPRFMFSGDPVSQVGWLNTSTDDAKLFVNSGPFTLFENHPVTIIVAYTLGQGFDRLNSVAIGKILSEYGIEFYQSNFYDPTLSINNTVHSIKDFQLFQNYPNPFNPTTKISWQSPMSSHQTLKVYDVLGNEVAILVDEYKPAGSYEVEFDATSLTSGIYFYRITSGSFTATQKMILLK